MNDKKKESPLKAAPFQAWRMDAEEAFGMMAAILESQAHNFFSELTGEISSKELVLLYHAGADRLEEQARRWDAYAQRLPIRSVRRDLAHRHEAELLARELRSNAAWWRWKADHTPEGKTWRPTGSGLLELRQLIAPDFPQDPPEPRPARARPTLGTNPRKR